MDLLMFTVGLALFVVVLVILGWVADTADRRDARRRNRR